MQRRRTLSVTPSPRTLALPFPPGPLPLAVKAIMTGSLLALSAWPMAAQAQSSSEPAAVQSGATEDATRHYDIPAGPLAQALNRFSSEAGIFLVGASELAEGKRSPGVQGRFNVSAALDELLADTGLSAQRTAPGRYRLQGRTASGESDLSVVTVTAAAPDEDQEQYDDVYDQNVTNLYIDREYLERYQTANPADVFKGMNGVYSMDARNGHSITPNIRGLSGEGRIPLTVDGTEQSTNVWLQVYGVGNRNYVDPALFRSIEVEKGPSLSRGIKSGVGGAVNVRTIEADDIIPEGDNFGIEVKVEGSGNTVDPQVDANSYFGMDYRDIPGAELGGSNNVNIPQPVPRTKDNDDRFNFDDHTEMLTIAARNEVTDFLISHSRRSKGNYFAGTHGADKYTNNDAYAIDTEANFPNLTKLYYPGNEILSTSSDTETTLVKNNWYLPDDHEIGLSFMRLDLEFAETGPAQALSSLGFAEQEHLDIDGQLVAEFPRSELRLDTYKLSHAWKPEGSRWIDLESSLWMTKTDGVRHQTGSGAYYIHESPALDAYNDLKADWDYCRSGNVGNLPSGAPYFNCFTDPSLNPNLGGTEPEEPDHDGTIYPGSAQWTEHDRAGFDVSNRMRLTDNLAMTVAGAFQDESLDERVAEMAASGGGIGPDGAMFHYATENYGPRSGERREYSGSVNFEWEPTSWLTLTAGTRYNRYSSYDEGLAERRRQQIANAAADRVKTGVELSYGELLTEEERNTYYTLAENYLDADAALTDADWDAWIYDDITTPAMAARNEAHAAVQEFRGGPDGIFQDYADGIWYWNKEVVVPIVDGKPDASQSPFGDEPLDETETVSTVDIHGQAVEVPIRTRGNTPRTGTAVYEELAADQRWAAPEKQSGEAWSPMLSATLQVASHSTLFARYAQTTRFPSIFEIASTSVNLGGTVGTLSTQGASKPERSTNWEIGYAHDLTQFFPSLYRADARLSYFDTTIDDFIERTSTLDVIQFDEKRLSGIEFQSRFDSGRFFGSLGATYRLDQKLCDEDYAYGMDVYYNRVPECMTGGFPDTLTATSLQPKYSINAELGTRLLDRRLELGWRTTYHAKAENDQLDDLLNTSYGADVWQESSMRQLFWHETLLHDAYARFHVNPHLSMNLGVTNVTDEYYMDPMSKIPVPGPGRTVTAGLKFRF
ncbi:TonB-dependent receptor [Billgrantia gudaonensis]|uniref:Hemoglobin/transferrin/lactoferrin receptor protein n=1 Tax=Billgrantia gudaonensis TaxID=376427 RepID=A0A1G8N0C7_9GAMM|nr:TonB-dependent receptor [Halomonas gudaonensis]SDI73634.1 hemoglobin/transferrin/lactoferrin receptor protein [Halomonas gudaonensis]